MTPIAESAHPLILDVMMPGLDGFEIVRRRRDRHVSTPTLMLIARGELEDRVRRLDNGADDYPVKPFAFEDLSARVWGHEGEPEPDSSGRHVHYLRRKLGDAARITTIRGVGYRLEDRGDPNA